MWIYDLGFFTLPRIKSPFSVQKVKNFILEIHQDFFGFNIFIFFLEKFRLFFSFIVGGKIVCGEILKKKVNLMQFMGINGRF